MITVRDATPHDADFLTDGNTRMAWETEHLPLDRPTLAAGVHAALADPAKARYFIAQYDGQPVGQMMITWEWSDWRNGPLWWIQSVYVLPDFRRRGAFRALYRHVRTLARQAHAVGLRLYVEAGNHPGQATYRNLGMALTHYLVMEESLPRT